MSTTTSSRTGPQSSLVDIDCERLPSHSSIAAAEFAVKNIVSWVEAHPSRSALRVVLRNATGRPAGRRLQLRLRTLGCTVTMMTRC